MFVSSEPLPLFLLTASRPKRCTQPNRASAGQATRRPAMVQGRDTSDFSVAHTAANSLADYTRITSTTSGSPTAGNYVQFDDLSLQDFYIRMEGVIGGTAGNLNGGGHGVALNGFEIVQVPEPATLALLTLAGAALLRRRQA